MHLFDSFTYISLETFFYFHLNRLTTTQPFSLQKQTQGLKNTFLTTFVLSLSCDHLCAERIL